MKSSRVLLGLVVVIALMGMVMLSSYLNLSGINNSESGSHIPATRDKVSSLPYCQPLPTELSTTTVKTPTTVSIASTTLLLEVTTSTNATQPPPPTTTNDAWKNTRFVHLDGHNSESVQQEKMCNVKYPPATIAMLKRTLAVRGVRKVAFIAILKDCMNELSSIDRSIFQVADVLSPENLFVSIVESGSSPNDPTPGHLRKMSDRLQEYGVSNVISTGKRPISAFWNGRVGSRIDFLSKLRNAAMVPALDGHPVGYFDKIFFVNDVYNCGGDILRLLAHDADIACGLDFGADNDDFYDKWVFSEWLLEKFDFPKWDRDKGFRNRVNTPSFSVFSCWNGGIATRAELWYNGVRFRQGMKELGDDDCSQSEATLWAMDAHTLGYNNVVLDTTVQSGYGWRHYVRNFRDSSPEIKTSVATPIIDSSKVDIRNISYRCCEIQGTDLHVDMRRCHNHKLHTPGRRECTANTTKCLRYTPSRFVEDWDWKHLLKKANNKTPL